MKEPPDKNLRQYQVDAASALGRIAPDTPHADQAVAALIEFLGVDHPVFAKRWVLQSAINALAKFGPKASGAIPRLLELQLGDDEEVRKAATTALASIQPAG